LLTFQLRRQLSKYEVADEDSEVKGLKWNQPLATGTLRGKDIVYSFLSSQEPNSSSEESGGEKPVVAA
jgi:hypothetical protein